MKDFDVEAAKAGAAVQTRDGRVVRILAYDAVSAGGYSVVFLVMRENGEHVMTATRAGVWNTDRREEHPNDLVMGVFKHERWMNVWLQTSATRPGWKNGNMYRSESEAKTGGDDGCIQVKVTWEV
jgi:hypothetical protein